MAKLSFHDLDQGMRPLVLCMGRDYGDFKRSCGGYSGNIYVFEHVRRNPPRVCAKVPKTSQDADAEEAATRFLREIKIQRSLYYHQFVHWPFDFDFILDVPVALFRMWDFDLSCLIEEPTFTTVGRISMLAYVTAGMRHCHRKGLLAHQDFKPENIFVRDLRRSFRDLPEFDAFRIPKIADFGSANLAAEKGIFRGTRAYMAPEQWDKQQLGEHTTVWSVGVMTYELLSYGRHPIGEPSQPWREGDMGVCKRWQKDAMWKRWRKAGTVPTIPLDDLDMDDFVRSCLRPEPEARPTLDEALARLLRRLRAESPEAYEQAQLLIAYSERDRERGHDWPYLDARYQWLVSEVSRYFDREAEGWRGLTPP